MVRDKRLNFTEFCALPLGTVFFAGNSVSVVNQSTLNNQQSIYDDVYGSIRAFKTPVEFAAYPVLYSSESLVKGGTYWFFLLDEDKNVDDSFYHCLNPNDPDWTMERGFKAIPIT